MQTEKFGTYIHIPFCLQRCLYCDFATYVEGVAGQATSKSEYINILLQEIETRSRAVPYRVATSIYFGGGTPSLLEPIQIATILHAFRSQGFIWTKACEITIEINPATVSANTIQDFINMGINRFSVGAQTFKSSSLKELGRKHNEIETLKTLDLLKDAKVNYSFDLLFALPHQQISDLRFDLNLVEKYRPQHVSGYCLTIPDTNPLFPNLPTEEIQIEMFNFIAEHLVSAGYVQYEISNFCLPGNESIHNMLYWQDHCYWGVGLSAHSYFKTGRWGKRFWNPRSMNDYARSIQNTSAIESFEIEKFLPKTDYEILSLNQSLTDFCHTSLRVATGLNLQQLGEKFGPNSRSLVERRLKRIEGRGLVTQLGEDRLTLSPGGKLLSNQVFSELTFLSEDLQP